LGEDFFMRSSGFRIGAALIIALVPAAVTASAGLDVQPPAAGSRPGPLEQAITPGTRLPMQLFMEIYITEGKMAVEGASVPVLENFIEQALKHPDDPIELNGHTDNRNSPAEELAESKAWADAIGHYLVSKGIRAERISTGGLGATQPRIVVAPGVRERVNRRVNMTLGEKNRGW
jgi:outer membrane protein OmpA-like peptidoglycan-associated protein